MRYFPVCFLRIMEISSGHTSAACQFIGNNIKWIVYWNEKWVSSNVNGVVQSNKQPLIWSRSGLVSICIVDLILEKLPLATSVDLLIGRRPNLILNTGASPNESMWPSTIRIWWNLLKWRIIASSGRWKNVSIRTSLQQTVWEWPILSLPVQ